MDAQLMLDDTYGKAQELQDSVETALGNLTSASSLPYLSWFDWASTPDLALNAPTNIALDALPPLGAMQALPAIAMPAMAAPETIEYEPTGFDVLREKITQIITSGGSNIGEQIQKDVFDVGRERAGQVLRDAMDMVGSRTGSKGFRRPTSMTKAQQTELLLNYSWQQADYSREITRTMANLAQQNLQAALASGVAVEQALSGIAFKTFEVLQEGKRLVLEKFKTEAQVAVTEFEAKVKSIQAGYEGKKYEFDAGVRTTQLKLEADRVVEELKMAQQGQRLDKWRTEVLSFLEKGKAQVQQSEAANALRMEALKQIAASYVGIMENIGAQAVSIVTKKT